MTKRTSTPTKKATVAKKSPARKTTSRSSNAKQGVYLSRARFFTVSVSIFLLAVTTVVVIAILATRTTVNHTTQTRLDKINDIYASLNLGESYSPTNVDVFGDKRVYEWDAGRSYSSAITYIHGDTVRNTVADADAKIKAAGFAFIDEPYPGSRDIQYHYKSNNSEYIRLSVASKPYWDAVENARAMGKEPSKEVLAMDSNAGPASVTVKVNLDDNNE